MKAKIVDKKLVLDGFVYLRGKQSKGSTYWDCRRLRAKECKARAITADCRPGENVIVLKGPLQSPHSHPPNQEECSAETLTNRLTRKAEENPEQPPAQILRVELAGVSSGVLSQLPERENLKNAMRRKRRKNLPLNPKSLNEIDDIPVRYTQTLAGESFLIFDSNDSDDDFGEGRCLVFATRRNLEILAASRTWFLDGTFKVSPTIFSQVFAVLGMKKKIRGEGYVTFPLVYALLSSKETIQYAAVLRAVQSTAQKHHIPNCEPDRLLTDFEKAIINACGDVFPRSKVSCCFFHLGQSVYRKVQSEGLQEAYNDRHNRELKTCTHMLLSLAFLPVSDVREAFKLLRAEVPDELLPVTDYFAEYYVLGRPGRERRRAVSARHPIETWNQYEANLAGSHRTNNISEGWHNRFQMVVGKHHPDLYSALKEIQKEQADTEIMLVELSLGRMVKAAPKKKWLTTQEKLQCITADYESYAGGTAGSQGVLEFLGAIAHNIVL